jgi:hypothetical protein
MLNEQRWKDYGKYVAMVTMRWRKYGVREGRKGMKKKNKERKET